MKVQSSAILIKLLTISFFIFLLSISKGYSKSFQDESKHQLGDRLLSTLLANEAHSHALTDAIASLSKSDDIIYLNDMQIKTTIELYKNGFLEAISDSKYKRLLSLEERSPSKRIEILQTLFILFPSSTQAIISYLIKNNLYDKETLFSIFFKSKPDLSVASENTTEPDIMRIGWGGGGAFSSIVEYKNEVYASSDVTGVWKYYGDSWQPFVKGLTNYNITGLLVHNDTLLAVTKKQVLELINEVMWSPVGLKLNTYRSTTLQLFSTSQAGTTCFAALEAQLGCIDISGDVTKKPLSIDKLKGVYFDESPDYIYGYNGTNLYRINLLDGSHRLEHTFKENILRIARISGNANAFVFTTKGVYDLNSHVPINADLANKNIVNVFIDNRLDNKNFIALGSTWNVSLYELIVEPFGLSLGSKVSVNYGTSLPYRKWRKSITKPIGMPSAVKGSIWFSDYWGIYQHDRKSGNFYEKSYNASNFVGTDIHIDNEKLYIASMDNGLVSMELNQPNQFINIFPRTSGDWLLAGHSWSVETNDEAVFATLSPWNLPQDYLITADKNNNFINVQRIDSSQSRNDSGSFWGQSYSRKISISENIYVYKDGDNGGLYKLSPSLDENIEQSTSEKVFSTNHNRVYRSLIKTDDFIVTYHIDDEEMLYFHDVDNGSLIKTVKAPSGFWAFNLEYIDGSLYLLGSLEKAVIYKFNERDSTFTEIVNEPSSSAFLSMKQAPDHSLTIAGAVSWGGESNGKVLLNTSQNNGWIDMTCLMANESGVVDIVYTDDSRFVYLLQQVGSIIRIKTSILKYYQGC
ncbi:hypothetical protein [Pseudoalteromonas sp. SG45-2]|uniref:hypothetical protein n=1 Tax=Pseudoalteromonas sp. SG45-2 TaxID=2760956 RepID=UPI001601CE59|nr:hypothetical protein [Pseudoalteromonas sp. SG45-2]MBB1344493.1 hypothetical protein [Pseudoalteromonas sp. SG45-2]